MQTIRAGEIVRLRRRLWRVDDVGGDELVATAIDGVGATRRRFHTALEQPEPAVLPAPDYTVVGQAASQDLLLRAYRLSMLHGSAPFLSLQRSSVIPVNYQLVPLVMALRQPNVRLLIADDVGIGKTIEAGLILSELLCRGQARRFLVVTPASLREQWLEALDRLFHIRARILSSQTRGEYERELPAGANPWQHFDRVIVSIDYAKEPETKLKILEQSWDLVLVDESHNAAKPHQAAPDQHVEMERWEFVGDLALRARHLLLITATPHNGYTDSFASLIGMLTPGMVAGPPHSAVINRQRARHHVCQRSRKDLQSWFDRQGMKSPFPMRDHDEDVIPPHRDFTAALDELEQYSNSLLDRALASRRAYAVTEWLVLHLQKRALSSPAALRRSLENRIAEIRARLEEAGQAPEPEVADRELVRAAVMDLDPGEKHDAEAASRRADRSALGDEAALRAQLDALDKVLQKARRATPAKDTKLQRLLTKHLPYLLARSPRLIVFTRYKDTLDYLTTNLGKALRDTDVFALHGDLSEAARREVFRAFERSRRAVLVATDVISEGLNLQHACCQVVHYELPWNPNRLEQRNGRVDRFGQREPIVTIRTLVMDSTLDIDILELLIKKAVRIRDDRGFCPPYFGDEVSIAHLIRSRQSQGRRRRHSQLKLFDPVDEALQRRISDPLGDEAVERIAEDSFYGEIDISLPDIEARLEQSHRLIGSPQEIRAFVESALNRYRCRLEAQRDDTLTVFLPEPRLQLPGIGAKLEKATFDPEQALADPDLTVLDIGHPLVQRLIEMVREDFFAAGADYGRVAALVTDSVSEVTCLCHYLVRFVVHTEPAAVIEELLPVAIPVYGEEPISSAQVTQLLSAKPRARHPGASETEPRFRAAMTNPLLERAIRSAVGARLQDLKRERHELKVKLEEEGDPIIAASLRGTDSLTVASQDLLTVTLYLPR